ANGSPNVGGWHPEETRPVGGPVSRPPPVARVGIEPGTRNVKALVVRSRRTGPLVQADRWSGNILIVLFLRIGPVAAHPAPARVRIGPVAGDPAPPVRHIAPQAADPDEIFALFVPLPVARNPLHVFPFRFDAWRLLRDRLRRLHRHHIRGRGIFLPGLSIG